MRQASEARRAAVVVNAGSRRGTDTQHRAADLLVAAGVPVVTTCAVTDTDDLEETVRRVVADRHDLVVVGGGDGTVGCAAGVLAGTETTLGILPLGTANDLARTLEVPTDLAAAVTALADGKVVDIDLGRAAGRPYVNVASVGLSVGVTEALTPTLKRRLGPVAYPLATLRAYRHHQPFSARLEFPDGDRKPIELSDLLQVAVGNGRYYGGGNAVSPTAGIDDHLLDVYAVVRGRLRDHLTIARQLRTGSFVSHSQVLHVTTRCVRLLTDPELPVNLDGEIVTETPCLFELERNAVHVVVPRDSTAATLDGPRSQRELPT